MTRRPEGETRKDRRRQWMAGIGVILIFLLLGVIVIQGVIQYRSQTNHHSSTVAQDATIVALLKNHTATIDATKTLEMEVASVIEGLPAADAQLAKFAQWLEICVGQDHETNCPAPPIPT